MKKKNATRAATGTTRKTGAQRAPGSKPSKSIDTAPRSGRKNPAAGPSGEYYSLFEQSPLSLWEEDFSAVKRDIDILAGKGVKNFRKYLNAHPEKLAEYSSLIRIINVNKSTLALYGAKNKQSFRENLDLVLTEGSAEAFGGGIAAFAQGKTSFEAVSVNRTLKGETLDIIIHMTILKGHEKDWSRVMVSIIDITDWKRKSKALAQSEEKLKAALEATEDGIIVVDAGRQVITMNSRFMRMWSLPKKFASKTDEQDMFRLLSNKIAEQGKGISHTMEVFDGARVESDTIRLKDGRYFDVHTRPLKLQGKISGRLWSFRDVTQHHKSDRKIRDLNRNLEKIIEKRTKDLTQALEKISSREEELHQSEEIFREAFDTAPHGMGIYDDQGRFIMTNRAFAKIVGYRPSELRKKRFTDITHPDEIEKSQDFFKKLMQGEIPSYQFEKRYMHKAGYPVWALVSVTMVRDSKGRPLRILGQIIDITQKKKTEWLLRDSEEMYRRLFDEAIDAIIVVDKEAGKIIDCNRAAMALLGRNKKEIIGAHHTIMHPPEVIENGSARTYALHATTRKDEMLETKIIRKDGTLRDVAIKASSFEYKGKTYMQGIFRDITEQKAAEDNIKLFFSITLDMLCIAGMDGFFRQISPSWQKTLGWTTEELLSRPFVEFVHPDDVEPTLKAVDKLKHGKTVVNFENRYRCSDGSYRWISWNSFAVREKQLIYAAARDMTLRRNEEERLRQSEENLRLVIEDLPLAMGIYSGKDVVYTNSMFTELFGYTVDEIATIDRWFELAYPDRYYRKELESVWKTLLGNAKKTAGKVLPLEVKIRCKDGSDKEIEIRATVIGERIIINFYDLTKRKQEESALIRARDEAEAANRAKSEFLANMSHEIRTPLNAVIGFSELLSDMAMDRKQMSYTRSIKTAGKSLLTLINDILDLSKIEAGMMQIQLSPVEIGSLFDELKEIFETAIGSKGLDFIVELDPRMPQALLLDEIRLRQVMVNLLGNAIKFTDRGHIKLAARSLPQKEDRSKIDIILLVEDSGFGIPEDNLEPIFESFMQSSGQNAVKYGGTGLGLSISKKLVEMMNGKITVTSSPGKGSTFFVTIREVSVAAVERKAVHEKTVLPRQMLFNNTRALVVDDVGSNRMLVMELLKKWGMRVIEAVNGQEAVFLAEQYRPDIIIMDLRMPVMDGYLALSAIKKIDRLKEIPVIALTASADPNSMQRIIKMGFSGYLIKPIDTEALMNEIDRCLPATARRMPVDQTDQGQTGAEMIARLEPGPKTILLREIEDNLMPILEKISGTILISDINALSEKIKIAGERNNLGVMLEWARRLNEYAGMVDVEGIKTVIGLIRQSRDYLKKTAADNDGKQ